MATAGLALAAAGLAALLRCGAGEPGAAAAVELAADRETLPRAAPASSAASARRSAPPAADGRDAHSAPSSPLREPAPSALVAAGVVRDPHGVPIAGAEIRVQFFGDEPREQRTRSDAAGRFALRAPEARGLLRVVAEHARHGDAETGKLGAGAPAALALALVLAPPSVLEGSALLAPGVSPRSVSVRLLAGGEEWTRPLDRDARFRAEHLRTRHVELTWLGPSRGVESGALVPLAPTETVELALGGTTRREPRDLRGALRAQKLALRSDATGDRIPFTGVSIFSLGASGGVRHQGCFAGIDGELDIVIESDTARAVLDVPGYRFVELELSAAAAPRELALAALHEYSLALDLLPQSLARAELVPTLELLDPDELLRCALGRWTRTEWLAWEEHALRLCLPAAGSYRFRLAPPSGTAFAHELTVATR